MSSPNNPEGDRFIEEIWDMKNPIHLFEIKHYKL